MVSVRSARRGWPLLERTLESSSQLAVRLAVVLVFGLVALAGSIRLDILLGGFVAGIVTRLALKGREVTFPFVGLALRRGRPDRSSAESVDALPSTAWGTVA
jgi:hypothetical protein